MSQFITRVELHKANYDDYEKLHTAMAAQGFSRQIESDKGTLYHLPTAEYNRITSGSRAQVLESAKVAANQTGKQYAILVTESNGITWIGLEAA